MQQKNVHLFSLFDILIVTPNSTTIIIYFNMRQLPLLHDITTKVIICHDNYLIYSFP